VLPLALIVAIAPVPASTLNRFVVSNRDIGSYHSLVRSTVPSGMTLVPGIRSTRSFQMRKLAAITAIALTSLGIGITAPMLLKAAPPGQRPQNAQMFQPSPDDNIPQRTARAFAPFFRAIVTRRSGQANGIFKLHRSVQSNLESAAVVQILARFRKPDEMFINLVGGRLLGQDMGILLFTAATETGPVAFKVYYYGYGQDMNIARMDISEDWDEIERLSATVDMMQVPISVPLGGQMGQ
jgi:hypothetical protein